MSGCLGPAITFPRRFVPRPDTCSPYLCRAAAHGHTGCAAPGQPAASPRRNAQAASRDKAAAQPNIEELRRELEENDIFIAKMLDRLRDFPDAAAAISEMIRRGAAPPNNQPPDFRHD